MSATIDIESPMQGTAVSIAVIAGDTVKAGQTVVLLESMKMLHDVKVPSPGIVSEVLVDEGATVMPNQVLCRVDVVEVDHDDALEEEAVDLERVRADLAAVVERHEVGYDEARPDAVARRRRVGRRTA